MPPGPRANAEAPTDVTVSTMLQEVGNSCLRECEGGQGLGGTTPSRVWEVPEGYQTEEGDCFTDKLPGSPLQGLSPPYQGHLLWGLASRVTQDIWSEDTLLMPILGNKDTEPQK